MKRILDLVSVIIPCYNHGKLIHEAIGSILNQTYQNFEIIVVDDGSDEHRTVRILDKLDFPKTTVYRKTNGGPASARNFGIQKSRGQYILTLDADDQFHPTFLDKSVQILNAGPEIGMVTSNKIIFYKNKYIKEEKKGGNISQFIIKNEANASLLFRYQCWEDTNGYDENIPGFEDWEFAIGVTNAGWIIYSIPEYLFFYKDLDGSQYDKDTPKRPEIIKYLAKKYEAAYKNYITDIVYAKELQIQMHSRSVNTYKNSYSQKIGTAIIRPMQVLRSILFT